MDRGWISNAQRRLHALILPLLIVTAGLLAYHNSGTGPFLFDDHAAITTHPALSTLWPPRAVVAPPQFTPVAGRPVAALSLAANYALGGLDVRGYHAFNLTVHLLAALVLFGLVRRTLRLPSLAARYGAAAAGLSGAITILWTVHPLLTECVNYTIQRTELLMGVFVLLTLYCVNRSLTSAYAHRWQLAAVASCALGMSSKEVAVVTPLLAAAYHRCATGTPWRLLLRRHGGWYAGFAACWLLLALLVCSVNNAARLSLSDLTPWRYAATQCGILLHYLRLAVWPHPLSIDYEGWPLATWSVPDIFAVLAVVLLLLAILAAWRRAPWLGFLGLWCVLLLAPTSSVLPLVTEIAAERRMYLPLAALMSALVLGGWRGVTRRVPHAPFRNRMAAGLAALAAIALGTVTVRRNTDYSSEERIWAAVVAEHPDYPRARYTLGSLLARAGRLDEAGEQLAAALRLRPAYAEAMVNLGWVARHQGRLREAVAHLERAVRLAVRSPEAHYNLGCVQILQGDRESALRHLAEAARLQPDRPEITEALRRAQAGDPDPCRAPASAVLPATRTSRLPGPAPTPRPGWPPAA